MKGNKRVMRSDRKQKGEIGHDERRKGVMGDEKKSDGRRRGVMGDERERWETKKSDGRRKGVIGDEEA
ncbi:hypothetical protein RIR_jg37885.t1 [Rhizophagus irregularis DAOM 181602=DAOM 197198]|nr:hypothetical protein RIR_jg38602.t1 [Rhizophagus irregularis DAOM 181602=DAOM 197198]GET57259.1 hypothetical protein RIR_jg26883.t1 [Rhizophagus irregularis DAOM 181602=DAOM 197198]GET58797.1 hypothetical protein RIR_jg13667.t1 [Rhizophagus irregularis DAOM 181602=DAOM 197198]GET66331.1 hypothetical protein RIR_jg37885.t1 [Rhizophagus irregularis DAOM 181602=DAOM 197198]